MLYAAGGYPADFAWSLDGDRLLVAYSEYFGPGSLVEIDMTQETVLRENTLNALASGNVGCFGAFSPDTTLFAFTPGPRSYPPTLRIWDTNQYVTVEVLSGYEHDIVCVAWSPDGRELVTTSGDEIIFWDTASWNVTANYSVSDNRSAQSIAWSPDGSVIAFGMSDGIAIWNAVTQTELRTLGGPTTSARSIGFSPDGSWLAAGDHSGQVWVWDVNGGSVRQTFDAGSAIRVVEWSPDGELIAVGTLYSQVYIWNITSGELLGYIVESSSILNALVWLPSGTGLIVGTENVTLWPVPR